MTLLALLLALLIERSATRLLHLREAGWFDGYARWAGNLGGQSRGVVDVLRCGLVVLLPVLPVAAVAGWMAWSGWGGRWLPLLFAALVLVFSLGPRDLADEVREYIDLETGGDAAGAAEAARVLIEHDAAQRRERRAASVEDAIFIQANNRVFGVLFWFVVLGPAGLGPSAAFLFRVSDLLRRRAIAAAGPTGSTTSPGCFERLHFVLAWVPARLLALSYALAGSFEEARQGWRQRYAELPAHLLERNDWLLLHVGRGALGAATGAAQGPAGPAVVALTLVRRALLAWLTVIACLSLVAWIA